MSRAVSTKATVLVVDDEAGSREWLGRLLLGLDYRVVTAGDGQSALAALQSEQPDIVLLDVMLPDVSGYDVCRRIKGVAATRLTPVIILTALEAPGRIDGILAGADDYLIKPCNARELAARVDALVRLKRYTDDLESVETVILSLAQTVEARDRYTAGHCERLARYATALGQQLDVSDPETLRRGGILHDVGKVGVPDSILNKPGPLSSDEFEVIRQHPIIGERLCGELKSLREVRGVIRHHHERADGSGYPDGLHGDRIPLAAQIVAIVDTYDAITTSRPYRPALSPSSALDELARAAARGHFSRDFVRAFAWLGRNGTLQAIADSVRKQQAVATPGRMMVNTPAADVPHS